MKSQGLVKHRLQVFESIIRKFDKVGGDKVSHENV